MNGCECCRVSHILRLSLRYIETKYSTEIARSRLGVPSYVAETLPLEMLFIQNDAFNFVSIYLLYFVGLSQ